MVTCPWSLDSPRRPLQGNPALLMVLAHLGTPGGGSEKGGPSLLRRKLLPPRVTDVTLRIGQGLHCLPTSYPRYASVCRRVSEKPVYRKPGFQEQPYSAF